MTPRIEPSEPTNPAKRILDKRQHVPFRVVDDCASCGATVVCDLANDDHLYAAEYGQPTSAYLVCKCGTAWTVCVVASFTLELYKRDG